MMTQTNRKLIDDLLRLVPGDMAIEGVLVGVFWTAVVVQHGAGRRCGLASTLRDEHDHGRSSVQDAGSLTGHSVRQLAQLVHSESVMEAAIGMAAVNAAILPPQDALSDINAGDVIARYGAGKQVAVVGHFPFIPWLRTQVGKLWVLELRPRDGDLPASAAAEVIPRADVLAITGTTLINRTFDELMALRRPGALVLVLGPSTPLSPILFDYGVHLLSGSLVQQIEPVLQAVGQGASFRQVRRAGVRLVTMRRDTPCD